MYRNIVFILIWNWDDAELKNEGTRSKKDWEEINEKMKNLKPVFASNLPHVMPDVIMGFPG